MKEIKHGGGKERFRVASLELLAREASLRSALNEKLAMLRSGQGHSRQREWQVQWP